MVDVSLGQAHEAELTLRKAGATPEFWTRIAQSEELARKVVELVNQRPSFKVTIDYGQTLVDMVKAGKYDWLDCNIIQNHFPIKGSGQQEKEVALFLFGRAISSDDAIAEMEKAGYRPARIEELLTLGASQPELQKKFSIIGLGSVWQSLCPCLHWYGGYRCLALYGLERDWDEDYRFAAVRNT